MSIKNTVAIVTGGSGGIGFATAQALLKHGSKHVAIFDINTSRNASSLEKLNKEFGNGKASVYTCDVTKSSEFSELYDNVLKTQKKVDILINSSGVIRCNPPDEVISINLTGVINATLTAIDRMGKHKNGRGGTIVNVASIVGLMSMAVSPVYCASKHGVIGFTTSLKDTFSHTGVRALTICPGTTETPAAESMADLLKGALDFIEMDFYMKYSAAFGNKQPAENVAEAIVKMINVGKSGDVWVSEDNKPPYAIPDLTPYKERGVAV